MVFIICHGSLDGLFAIVADVTVLHAAAKPDSLQQSHIGNKAMKFQRLLFFFPDPSLRGHRHNNEAEHCLTQRVACTAR
jgi:hypothetical protein